MSLPEPLMASTQHIKLLQDKRRRLAGTLVSAELQFLAALRRECLSGEVSWVQLRDAYSVLSAGGLPGLRARWMDAISLSPENVILNAKREAALLSAELRFVAALRDAYQSGEMTWVQLRDAYSLLSAVRLPGLRARWMDAVPVSPENVILNARREAAGGAGGVWKGTIRCTAASTTRPLASPRGSPSGRARNGHAVRATHGGRRGGLRTVKTE
jgi:hypothetical protein